MESSLWRVKLASGESTIVEAASKEPAGDVLHAEDEDQGLVAAFACGAWLWFERID